MLDSGRGALLLDWTTRSGREVGRAGGAEPHGAAVPGRASGGAGRVERRRGGPSVRGVPPERSQLDRQVPGQWPERAGRSFPPTGRLPAPDPRGPRGPDLRAPPGAPGVGTAADRAPAGEAGPGHRPLPVLGLPMPETPRPDRAPAPPQAPGGVPSIREGATHGAVAEGRDGRAGA